MGLGTPVRSVHAPDAVRRVAMMPVLARALLGGVALLATCSLAAVASWYGPERPLSDDEKLALTVSQSDAIVVARVTDIRGAVMEVPSIVMGAPSTERTRFPFIEVELQPIRWLKGPQEPDDLHIGMHQFDVALGDLGRAKNEEFIGVFFLWRAPSRWMIQDYPGGYNKGHIVRLERPTGETAETRAIEAMVARQSLDSLLLRADLVVLGYRDSVPQACPRRVRVDSVLVGRAPADTILVCSPFLLAVQAGPAVHFLSRLSSGQYETIDFYAGCDPVQADTLARLGIPLRHVFQRAAELRPRHQESVGARP